MRGCIRNRQSVVVSKAGIASVLDPRSACKSRLRRGLFEGNALIRRVGLIITLLAISACGFEPLHSQSFKQSLAVDLSSVSVTAKGETTSNNTTTGMMPRRYAELLSAEIEDQIDPNSSSAEKLFKLSITYTELDSPQFVKPDGTASRGDLIYSSTYSLTRIRDGKSVAAGSIQRVSSYNASPNADYASYVSIEDARKRGIVELAQDYKLRLATLLPTLNNPNAGEVVPAAPPAEPMPTLQPLRNSHEALRPRY